MDIIKSLKSNKHLIRAKYFYGDNFLKNQKSSKQ
jgi:hypothetical protein